MVIKEKEKIDFQPSITDAFGNPTKSPWNPTANAAELTESERKDIDHDIRSNTEGILTIVNITKEKTKHWKPKATREWLKWNNKYEGPKKGFEAADRYTEPGQVGYKTGRVILTRMITQNPIRLPSTLLQYTKLIKQIWDDRSNLSKGEQGQTLREFVMRAAMTDLLEFFPHDWDKEGCIYANEDTKAWWAIQKLSGMQCASHRKAIPTTIAGKHKTNTNTLRSNTSRSIPSSSYSPSSSASSSPSPSH